MGKVALVLSGGGFRSAFQVGALEVIRNNWDKLGSDKPPLNFDVVSGVSGGALNGLLIAQNKFDDLIEIWNKIAREGVGVIYNSDFINTNFDKESENPQLNFKINWRTIRKYFPETTKNILFKTIFNRRQAFRDFEEEFQKLRALADNTPLLHLLKNYAKKENFGDDSAFYLCGYVSLNSGKYYSVQTKDFKTDKDFAKGVLASTSMPIIWPPVSQIHLAGATHFQCIDGGVRSISPMRAVIDFIKNNNDPEDFTIIIINCGTGNVDGEFFKHKNIAQIALRALSEIATSQIFTNDIREFVTRNYFIEQIKRNDPNQTVYDFDFDNKVQGKPLHYFKSIVIQPDSNQVLGNSLTANAKQLKVRIDHGRKKADIALKIHKGNGTKDKTTVV